MYTSNGLSVSNGLRRGKTQVQAPAITDAPTISGMARVGETLLAAAATVTGTDPIIRTWQWLKNGTGISGATAETYGVSSADEGATLSVLQTETNDVGSASATSLATDAVAPAAKAPAITGTSFDDGTDTATFTTDKDGTLHWAIYLHTDGGPSLNPDGTWTGTMQETGTETVPTSGSGSLVMSYTATIGDRLIYGMIDAEGNVSNLIIETITLAVTLASTPALAFVSGFEQELDLASDEAQSFEESTSKFPAAGDYLVVVHSLNNAAGDTLDVSVTGSNATEVARLLDTSGVAGMTASTSMHIVRATAASSLIVTQSNATATGESIVRYVEVYSSDVSLSATAVTATNTEVHTAGTGDLVISTTLSSVPASHSVLAAFTDREGQATLPTTWSGSFATGTETNGFSRSGLHYYSSKTENDVESGDFALTATQNRVTSVARYYSLAAVAVKAA